MAGKAVALIGEWVRQHIIDRSCCINGRIRFGRGVDVLGVVLL